MPCDYCSNHELDCLPDDYKHCFECNYSVCYKYYGSDDTSEFYTACSCCHRDFCGNCEVEIEKRSDSKCTECHENCTSRCHRGCDCSSTDSESETDDEEDDEQECEVCQSKDDVKIKEYGCLNMVVCPKCDDDDESQDSLSSCEHHSECECDNCFYSEDETSEDEKPNTDAVEKNKNAVQSQNKLPG